MAVGEATQARALRRITGLPLAHCKRVLAHCDIEKRRGRVIKRRSGGPTVTVQQMDLTERPLTESEISAEFAALRASLEDQA